MPRKDIQEIRARKEYYPEHYRKIISVCLISLIVNGGLVLLIAYAKLHESLPDYYASNSAGIITPLMRVSGPNMSSKALLEASPPAEEQQKTLNVS